jgi:hypothetical protein
MSARERACWQVRTVLSQLFCLAERGQAVSPHVQNTLPLKFATITVSCPIDPVDADESALCATEEGMGAPTKTLSRYKPPPVNRYARSASWVRFRRIVAFLPGVVIKTTPGS